MLFSTNHPEAGPASCFSRSLFLTLARPRFSAILGFFGLLLFGKDLPTIARNVARQYYFYKRKFADATADLRREMDNAASVIEEEKRKLEREVTQGMPNLNDLNEPPAAEAGSGSETDLNLAGTSDQPAPAPVTHATSMPPPETIGRSALARRPRAVHSRAPRHRAGQIDDGSGDGVGFAEERAAAVENSAADRVEAGGD